MIHKLKNFIMLIQEWMIWYRCSLVKKENTLWVFGAVRGEKYMDNAKYLFEYVHFHTPIRAVWISRNRKVIKFLKKKGFEAYHADTLQAKELSSRAKVAVITHRGTRNDADIPMHYLSSQTLIIQLWHGIPLKKIAFDDYIFRNIPNEKSLLIKFKNLIKKRFFPFLEYVHHPSLIPALSKETQTIFSKAFHVSEKRIPITGYPRNDILMKYPQQTNNSLKKIIYLPTFRGKVHATFDLFSSYGFNTYAINNFLKNNHMQLDIKLHPFNLPTQSLKNSIKQASHISFLDIDDIYEILPQYDILITDYSSIYFDYLLLDRPIIFTPFDKEIYLQKDRKFYFEYDEITPGPKAVNWEEVMLALKDIIANPHLYAKERMTLKNRFHHFQDSYSTQRVYNHIQRLLQ